MLNINHLARTRSIASLPCKIVWEIQPLFKKSCYHQGFFAVKRRFLSLGQSGRPSKEGGGGIVWLAAWKLVSNDAKRTIKTARRHGEKPLVIKWFTGRRLCQISQTILHGMDAILRVRDKWLIFNMIPQLWADVKYRKHWKSRKGGFLSRWKRQIVVNSMQANEAPQERMSAAWR